MHPFIYERARSHEAAAQAVRGRATKDGAGVRAAAQFIAGGTNMADYMRLNVARPDLLVDLNDLPDRPFRQIDVDDGGLHLGALVRMADAEDHPAIRRDYPLVADALRLAATRQIRNMASLGGNVLQRTRCEYFRDTSSPCNRRDPGSGCAALEGFSRRHAILGTSEHCIATYPGDFAQALIALDATVRILGRGGPRTIAFAGLHRQPGNTPHIETALEDGDLIAGYSIPAGPWTRRSRYVKVRDRDSYQFAITAAAVALHLEGEVVREARIALGGVATVPWRAHEAEAALKDRPLDEAAAEAAAQACFAKAATRPPNAFKVPIGKETVIRALLEAKAMQV
jgi:xanthine dehydrogenase YagS FAD-binding subunit